MRQFKIIDNAFGWITFLIAAFVYCSTIEPTASFWDCPEFITSAYKLEIGHPPGAPFFALTANFLSLFVDNPSNVARMVNTMSALLSATCIMFLFWTISHLARRLIIKDESKEISVSKIIAIEGAAIVGALIYTFSDTFWFSAVEGEVYAYSSAFTAIVFWLILKWENNADKQNSDRWIVLIAYMIGLSIGVHLLNLLCIPAIVLIYYYRKNPNADLKGSIIALIVSILLLTLILYGIVPGIVKVGGFFELFFTNSLGFPFNTGTIIYIILLVASFIWAILETHRQTSLKRENIAFLASIILIGLPFIGDGWTSIISAIIIIGALFFLLKLKKGKTNIITSRIKNTALLSMLMIIIGYSSYALVVIRSTENPPMDQNSPEDIFTLGRYLSRTQYGDYPLLYGKVYSSQPKVAADGEHFEIKEGAPIYERKEKESPNEKDSYFIAQHKYTQVYEQNMFFPRMWDELHAKDYESVMGGIEGREEDGVKVPTQLENLQYFIGYQCNFMYWRYFLWNFAGRQNDIQGLGEPEHGNWITGISFIDNALYGDQNLLPDELKANKGHNVFYCLPLLLGIIGLVWQAWKGKRGIQQFWVIFFLFFMTGLAIVIYINQTPSQPRERDYAYAGSFYAYAIWCGLGVMAIYEWISKKIRINPIISASIAAIASILVPIQMASQTWDDHDRSGRYTARDFGQNYLNSLQEKGNPIIFTNGDNDTFPLWYNQDVEGVRTDARVCNLSYLQTDWYIDQMKRPAYSSPQVPINWPRINYIDGTNEVIQVDPSLKEQVKELYKNDYKNAVKSFGKEPFELKNVLKYWVQNKDKDMRVIPTDTLYMTIDKNAVKESNMLIPTDSIPDKMVISLAGRNKLYKHDLMMLEMIANCNWTRPLYVAITVGSENFMNLSNNFIQEGLVNRITPFNTKISINYDTEKTYNIVMNKFKWGGISKHGIYLDDTVRKMCYTHRRELATLALNLIAEGKKEKAIKVLAKAEKEIPAYNIPMNFMSGAGDIALAYAQVGQKAKALKIYNKLWLDARQYLRYYLSLTGNNFQMTANSALMNIQIMNNLIYTSITKIDKKWANSHVKELNQVVNEYKARGGRLD